MSISAGADLFRHSVAATHEEIAAELGTAREVVSRLLKDFAGAGAIEVGRGRVELRDEAILRERA
jgi:CRP/FNR family transcriptional regulator